MFWYLGCWNEVRSCGASFLTKTNSFLLKTWSQFFVHASSPLKSLTLWKGYFLFLEVQLHYSTLKGTCTLLFFLLQTGGERTEQLDVWPPYKGAVGGARPSIHMELAGKRHAYCLISAENLELEMLGILHTKPVLYHWAVVALPLAIAAGLTKCILAIMVWWLMLEYPTCLPRAGIVHPKEPVHSNWCWSVRT